MAFNGDLQNAKLVLLGEMGAGKSSLAQRFVKGEFNPSIDSTIGAAFLTKVMPEHGIKWEIWDTAGQERYHSLAPMYYRSAVAAIVVFDLSNPDSFERAKKWVTELRAHGHPGTKIALAANKCDLDGDNMVDVAEAQRYADQALLDVFLPTSARDGTNVTDLFSKLADKVPRSRPVPTAPQNAIDIVDGNSNPRKTGCC